MFILYLPLNYVMFNTVLQLESAKTRLVIIWSASGWKETLYDFEEQGPPHNNL